MTASPAMHYGNSIPIESNTMRTESTSSGSVTAEAVLDALERYTRESNESDRETATKLGINRVTLKAWLRSEEKDLYDQDRKIYKCLFDRLPALLKACQKLIAKRRVHYPSSRGWMQ